ncbi:MAG: hypothetical protein WBA54_10835 [Acidaminobacteraceae bacterium]
MQSKIHALRRVLVSLEDAVSYCNIEKFNNDILKIEELVESLKDEFYDENSIKIELEKSKKVLVKEKVDKFNGDVLNTLEFVYKPVTVINVYDGNYLEEFSERRTEELSKAYAINNHNEFWKQHSTINGNVYGSVPCELIKQTSIDMLIDFGWKSVEVDIVDYNSEIPDLNNLTKYCESLYSHFIIINEQNTNEPLVLHYKI